MKSNNITTDRTLNALRRHLSRTLVLLSLLTLGVGQMWALDIYLDISACTGWPSDGATIKLYPGTGSDVTGTSVATNLYKFTVTSATGTMWFKRMSGSTTWNQGSVTYSSGYNLYKLTGWDAVACSGANINTVTKSNYIYFVNNIGWTDTYKYFVIGHDQPTKYSKVYSMSSIAHTQLLYVANTTDNWTDATYYGFCETSSSWGNGDWGSDNLSNATKYTGKITAKKDLAASKYYLFDTNGSASDGATLYISDAKASYTDAIFKTTLTGYRYVLATGETNFASSSNNSIGTVSISGYTWSARNAANTVASASLGSNASASITPAITSEITLTASPGTGYTFVGWYTSAPTTLAASTPVSTDLSYTYNIGILTTGYRIYAGFVQEASHDVTISYKCGTATIKTSTTESAVGTLSSREVTAPDIDGYTFSSWTKGSGITITSGSTSTATISITSGSSNNTLTANYTAKACTLYKSTAAKNGTLTSVGAMTFDESSKAYYRDVTTNSSPYYFRFNYNSGTYYSTNWSSTSGTDAYTSGKTVTANGSKVDCDQNVTSWGDKPSIKFNGLNSSAIRIWFDYQSKKVWITETTYAVTINNGDHGTVSPNGSQSVGKNSGKSITATPATGYNFTSWSKTGGAVLSSTTTNPTTVTATATGTVTATYTAKTYNITLDREGATTGSTSVTMTYNSSSHTSITAPEKIGYTFGGWYSEDNGTGSQVMNASGVLQANVSGYTGASGIWTKDAICTLYAKWTANTYTISFVNTGTGYASGGQTANKTATYNAAMPSVSVPTASTGYKFMGYYDALEPLGTQYYTATGASAHVWDKASNATLYAYYAPATITSVTLNHEAFEYEASASGDADLDNVQINAVVITPTGYVTPINVTWELQYSNGNPVAGYSPTYNSSTSNLARFSIVGLARGTYQLHATVRTGSTRGSGTVISTYDKPFQIASDYDITVNYKCDTGDGLIVIKAPTSVTGYALDATEITAPEITGYSFSKWRAGDGVTITGADSNGEKASATISFTATFDGSLTAIYTRKNLIYFNNTLGWSDVYVYFYSNDKYWDDSYGTGAYKGKYFDGTYPYTDMRHGHMTQIEGTNIWYFDYTAAGYPTLANVAFADMDKSNSGTDNTSDNSKAFFCNTTAQPMKVARRGDHSASLPMFVPLSGQTGVLRNESKARYYDSGYWMNYPENTGYWLKIWDGSLELYNKPFEFTPDKTMPMSIDVNLDAEHTYEFKIYRIDNNWYGNNGTMKNGSSGDVGQTVWEFQTGKDNCKIITSAAGNYTFTLNYGYKSSAPVGYHYLVGVHYPAAINDFQVLYNDRATWSLGYAHSASWIHPSRMIEARAGGVDTISFFVAKDNTPILKARRVGSIAANTGIISWSTLTINGNASQSISVSESGVYNFKVTQGAKGVIASIENIGAYTGNYYIRCQALTNGWGNYRDETDHLMTYTEFSENRSTNTFGELYSHYKAKWCERNTNIKFCIANDYSPCITDTLIQDVPNSFTNTESDGTLKYEKNGDNSMKYNNSGNAYLDKYSANIRFMWNRTTNKISRAYVAAATSNEARFLVLQGSGTTNSNIFSSAGNSLTANPPGANAIKLQDDQNWIYETTIMANPSALIKLYATYNTIPQYFCGTSAATFVKGTTALELLGGSASSTKYSVRVIYDFKTNRLVCAWIPTGHTQDISESVTLNSDVMFVREHQEEAQCITFSNPPTDKLSQVKTVYGSMKFNRWILGNRANPTDTDPDHCDTDEHLSANHPPLSIGNQLSQYERALYFISFPFDVKLSEVFGFGQYGVHWVIEYYDGLTRAKNGYWIDSDPNWKFVDPDMAQTYELKKGVGYILCLNLSRMAYNDREFWSNNISETELFFPSKSSTIGDITAVNETIPALGEEYKCTINRPGTDGDRRIKDSYWRCIGVPGYSTYNGSLSTSGSAITWKTDDTGEFDISKFPFLYAWNTADNSLTAQATTNYRFKATHAYLVQNGNQIVWSKGNFRNSIVARRQKAEDIINTDWRLTISRNDQMEDQAFVRMSDNEDVTEEFDFGQDLVKELNSGRSNIYSYIGYERCAANSMPINTTSTTTVPLGIKVPETGDYTIALPDGASGINIILVDAETGNRTNLSAGLEYTLTLEAGDYNDRFFLEIAPIQHIATGIDEINGEANGSTHKVLINGILYIVRDGKMFDARGSRVE